MGPDVQVSSTGRVKVTQVGGGGGMVPKMVYIYLCHNTKIVFSHDLKNACPKQQFQSLSRLSH